MECVMKMRLQTLWRGLAALGLLGLMSSAGAVNGSRTVAHANGAGFTSAGDDGVFLAAERERLSQMWSADANAALRSGQAIALQAPLAKPGHAAGVTPASTAGSMRSGALTASAASVNDYVYFPTPQDDTLRPTDAKFLVLAGTDGTATLGQGINIKLAAPAGATTLDVGLFDGDLGTLWDQGSGTVEYQLFEDPEADGPNQNGGDIPVVGATWTGADMADNAWTDLKIGGQPINISNVPAAPSGVKFFYLRCRLTSSTAGTLNCFKVRTTASVRLQPQNSFSVIGSVATNTVKLVYPNYPSLSPTTYDGSWDFYVYVPTSIFYDENDPNHLTGFEVWDGDLDYGSQRDATIRDTDDVNTPNNTAALPFWAQSPSLVPEGVASGFSGTTGNPPDDISQAAFWRGPSIMYDVTDPAGTRYFNTNPSGNMEWERFRIETRDGLKNDPTVADYAAAGSSIPSGIFQMHVQGMDLSNLNAFRFEHDILGVDITGRPRQPLLPYLVGDTVFLDQGGTPGVQDPGEPGVAGITMELLDEDGFVIKTTTTDSNGNYWFNVDSGIFAVQVALSNFGEGGALQGMVNTTGNTLVRTVTNHNDLTYDFGYRSANPPIIGDRVWYDFNGDGVQDSNEPGIPGVTVRLRNTDTNVVVVSTTTGPGGLYLFANPPTTFGAHYRVEVVPPANLTETFDKDGTLDNSSVPNIPTATSSDLTNDFGYRATGANSVTIGDRVWSDLNANHAQDANEPGLGGIRVVLSGDADANGSFDFELRTTTDTNGNYLFSNLPPGRYCVAVDQNTLPLGLQLTFDPSSATPPSKGAVLNFSNNTRDGAADSSLASRVVLDQDFGYSGDGSLGDTVWLDVNGNKVQDTGELGIAGVRVNLAGDLNLDGTVDYVASTTTDSLGKYLFAGLAGGSYTVTVDTSSFAVPLAETFDRDGLSTADRATGVLTARQTDLTFDFGYQASPWSSVGDTVWLDSNLNGVQDSGEAGIAGATVTLRNALGVSVATTTTDASGKYLFGQLLTGVYSVTVSGLPSGLTATFDLDGIDSESVASFTLGVTENKRDVDFGYGYDGSVGDTVWMDLNANGVQEEGEAGIAGVTVTLYKGAAVAATTATDASGIYFFGNLAPGSYSVAVSGLPAGVSQTFDLDGTATGNKASFTLDAGADKLDVDFGYNYSGSVGDTVWLDNDLNGAQNGGEAGISGVTVTLKDGNGTTLATATTDSNGQYLFNSLPAGSYSVVVSNLPTGAVQTYDLDGVTTASKASFTLAAGEAKRDVDFGYGRVGRVGDRVWLDANRNGVQDSGETGIAGVTVTLLDGTGATVGTDTTDADGLYLFETLPAGNYSVVVSNVPAILIPTFDLDGIGSEDQASFSLGAGVDKRDVDFGFAYPLSSVGDRVWLDANRNSAQDSGETGIAGVTVKLLNASGATVATATTDADGLYLFDQLEAGSYSVVVSGFPAGSVQTFDLDGLTTANKASFSLSAGEAKRTVDFGYAPPFASVGDRVWLDANRNGVQDSGEIGISGVAVKLLDSTGATVATKTTDASGLYLFDQLEAGAYTVVVTPPTTLTQTFDLDGLSTAHKASFSLSAGDAKRDVDFGYGNPPAATTASVGDRVWRDSNMNGVQDTGELGISGVTVTLRSGTTTVATATTNANGEYLFSNLAAGSYSVTVTAPSGLTQTFDLDGLSTANKASFLLASGDAKRDVDFGYGTLGSIGDRVWLDCDLDGVQDSTESGLACITVKLYSSTGTLLATTTTSSTGYYLFSNLAAGSYQVVVSGVATGLSPTYDLDGVSSAHKANVTLAGGQNRVDVDFGYGPIGSIGDRVWLDSNGNGCQDSGEAGIAGVTVTLRNSAGTVLATATTDANGYYLFDNLVPTTYSVTVSNIPTGYTQTYDLDGTSTPNKVSGALGSGENRRDVDFGYKPAPPPVGSIGDKVWLDCDLDGVQDTGEGGLSCVTVKLYSSTGTLLATTTTNSSGNYLFSNLPAGTYTVIVSCVSCGLSPTFDLDGIATESKAVVTLTAGQNRRDVDFGYGPVCSVGDRVWLDTDGDRCQDSGEAGIAGLTVKLLNSSGTVIATTTTDSTGNYLFDNLAPGDYSVTVSGLPAGYTQTYDLDGTSTASKASFSLSCGDDRRDVDFGYKPAAATTPFTTYTQGGWGASPSGSNPGMILKNNFSRVFSCGVKVGGRYTLTFTSSSAVDAFLPSGGTANKLTCSATNPTSSSAGVLAGQVLAMQLSLSFSDAGVTRSGLGSLKLQSGKFAGYTLTSFCSLANRVLGGDTSCLPSGATIADVNDAATKVNENFDNGTTDKGFLR
jgi:hypothetical protein